VSTSYQSRLVSTVVFDGMHHVHSDTLAVRSRIESNSLVNERLVLINLIEFSRFSICPHGVAIDSIEFQSFGMVARDLEAMHAHRLAAEGVQLSLVIHANQLLLGLSDPLEAWKFPTWFIKKSIGTRTNSYRDWIINPKT